MLTLATRHRDFPALDSMTYLNTAAESIPPLCVGEALQAYWQDKLRGMKGRDCHFQQVEECREIAARMISLKPAEVSSARVVPKPTTSLPPRSTFSRRMKWSSPISTSPPARRLGSPPPLGRKHACGKHRKANSAWTISSHC